MISSWTSSLSRSIQGFFFPAVEGSLELSQQLSNSALALICEYLSPEELERLTSRCQRIKHLAFHSSSEGGEAVLARHYRRDYPSSMAYAERLLSQKATRFRDISLKRSTDPSFFHTLRSRGLRSVGMQALATLEQSSTWPATRADVLARLYHARPSVHNYGFPQILHGRYAALDAIQLADGCLASASFDGMIRIWPSNGGEPLVLAGHNSSVLRLIQLEDGRIASASSDGTIRIWPLDGGAVRVLAGHTNAVLNVIQLLDGRIASSSDDGTIRIWTLDGSAPPLVLAGHTEPVIDIIQLADGRIASASFDGTIRIWTLDGSAPPLVLAGHNGSVLRIIQLADGRIASALMGHTIRIWPLDGDAPRVLVGHTSSVYDIIQLADGRIASASDDGTIRIWRLDRRAPPLVLAGHNSSVLRLIQLANGCIASSSYDGTIRIWPLGGGEPRALEGHNNAVRHLIQLADRRIVSLSDDRTIRIWGCNTNKLVLTATRQARYRKAMHQVSRKAIMALKFVLLAWVVNVLLTTIARRLTHTT